MRAFRRIVFSIILMAVTLATVACNKIPPLSKDTLDIVVGEYIDIADYVEGDFAVNIEGSAVMAICDTVIKGLAPGVATATVIRGKQTDVITVNVGYAQPELSLSCSSSLFTTVKDSVLSFTADLGSGADQSEEIIWEVNGNVSGVGKTFELVTNAYAKYVVSALAAGQEQSLTAVCYPPFAAPPYITAQSVTATVGESVSFTSFCDTQVPGHTVWYVDGEAAYEGEQFNLTADKVGKYNVFARVNGVATNEITVTVGGKSTVDDVRCDFDTHYPNIYLKWNGPRDATYEVKIGEEIYTSDDKRFGENQFDLSGIVDLSNSTSVSLRCLGNEYATPSDIYTIVTPTVTEQAKEYLDKRYFDGNYYVTSDREIYDIIAYAMIFRPQITQVGLVDKVTLSLYCGYGSSQSAALLLSKGWAFSEQTGSYSLKASGVISKGNVITLEITFYTVGEPDEIDVSYKTAYPSLTTPGFGNGYEYLSDKPYAQVRTSDELYYVVQKGYAPRPVEGSSAERIFVKAQEVLSSILSPEMDEEQRVRAIFEWIMWQTVYDYEAAAESNVARAVRQPAYYLEGVFDYGFAVCDGIAKSMSLLCNMVDVPCVRVVGIANDGSPTRHAWNKVSLDGKWYVVDATWSDSKITIDGTTYEGGLHAYYLKSDGEMPTHKATYPELYPAADEIYDWYGTEREYSLGTADMFVTDTSLDELSASIKCGYESATYEVRVGEQITQREFYCIEIRLSQKAKSYFKVSAMLVNAAINASVEINLVPWTIVGDYLIIMIYNN